MLVPFQILRRPTEVAMISKLYKSIPTRALVLSALLLSKPALSQEKIELHISASPLPWVFLVLAVVVIILLLAAIFVLVKKSIGEEVKIQHSKRQNIEESYVRKIRSEYMAKQSLLDQKIEKVRQRFSMVFMKVKSLLDTLDPDKLFKAIVEMIETDIGSNRYILFLLDPEKNELYPFRWAGYSDKIKEVLFIPIDHTHILTQSVKRRQTLFRAMAAKDAELRGIIDRKPVSKTQVAIPICATNKIFGVIHIETFTDGHTEPDENEIRFFSALPTFLGGALANADVFVQTREELTSAQKVSEKEITEKRKLKEIFSRYSSSELVEALIKNPENVDLGGVNKEAAIMFCDIVGFTNFSSKLNPKEIVSHMNEYLSSMTDVILDYHGEIDKFIGDAIMARFGVMSSLAYPGRSAVESAIAMLVELDKLHNEWAKRGTESFKIRIGIATGTVLAGNIGSTKRQEFTVMGNTVNLSSRLEALNKEYGTQILIDENTFKQLPKNIKVGKRENVRIRGLDQLQTIYEVQEYASGAKVIPIQKRKEQSAPQQAQPPEANPISGKQP
jgi:class 3 adenylate cyclase